MFTGIIQEVGNVHSITKDHGCMQVFVTAPQIFKKLHVGDSVAVNGVCLTVKSKTLESIGLEIMPETLRKTHFDELQEGAVVNIEPSLVVGDVVGGHWVQAHVDDVAEIVAMQTDQHRHANAVLLTVRVNKALLPYIVHKGFIGIEGASLTVAKIEDDHVTVSLVEHTMKHTTFHEKKAGDKVNIEVDVLAKYVEKMLNKR